MFRSSATTLVRSSVALFAQDCEILKLNNFNAVRTCHYPNATEFYRLCDWYGLYVCDEANVEVHGMQPMGKLAADPAYTDSFAERATRMAERDRNHASIICWSLGNESGRGECLSGERPMFAGHGPTPWPTTLSTRYARCCLFLVANTVPTFTPMLCLTVLASASHLQSRVPASAPSTHPAPLPTSPAACSSKAPAALNSRTSSAPCTRPSPTSTSSGLGRMRIGRLFFASSRMPWGTLMATWTSTGICSGTR